MASNNGERPFSFIIYGATGFTGKYCMEYMVKCMQKLGLSHNWAIAGRSASRLITAKNDVADILGVNLDDVPVIVADNNDNDSVVGMCKKCNVLINCVGPYTLYGEVVVRACIESKTHQVDIAGEGLYLINIRLKYHKTAEEAGVLIVNLCGVASLASEVGLNYIKDACKPNVLNSVECYMNGMFSPGFHQGSFESMLHAVSSLCELFAAEKRLRDEVYNEPLPEVKHRHRSSMIPFYSEQEKGWCLNTTLTMGPMLEKVQHSNYVVLKERPTQIGTYMVFPNLLALIVTLLIVTMSLLLSRCKFCIRFLIKYCKWLTLGFVTSEGPRRDAIMRSNCRLTFCGKGWRSDQETDAAPDVERVAVVEGPNGPYILTSICLLNAAFTIAEEFGTESMPFRGGVFTPGVVFRSTRIVQRLQSNSVTFSLLK